MPPSQEKNPVVISRVGAVTLRYHTLLSGGWRTFLALSNTVHQREAPGGLLLRIYLHILFSSAPSTLVNWYCCLALSHAVRQPWVRGGPYIHGWVQRERFQAERPDRSASVVLLPEGAVFFQVAKGGQRPRERIFKVEVRTAYSENP